MNKRNKKQRSSEYFQKLNDWLSARMDLLFWIIWGMFIFTGLLLFNVRVSEGGDDSSYIIRAINLLDQGSYPSFQGPLYPIFLSGLIAIFGLKLGLLKLSSLALMATFLFLFFKAFKNRIQAIVLVPVMVLLAINAYLQYFSSQTYSEAFFMALMGGFLVYFFNYLDRSSAIKSPKDRLIQLLPSALLVLLLFLTRTVGIGLFLAVIFFFLIRKDFKNAIWFFLASLFVLIPWLLLKQMIWEVDPGMGKQATTLIYKHPYDFSKGKEDLMGYFQRFTDNSNLYLSKHFLKMIGWRAANVKSVIYALTILLYALLGWGLYRQLKQNKYLLFTGLLLIFSLGITFVSLQKLWDQYRLIIPYFPLMSLFLLAALVDLFQLKRLRPFQWAVVLFVIFSVFFTAGQTVDKLDLLTLRSNLQGDKFKGYTADWENYLKMTEYVGQKLPEETYVACRKPNMARLYANGKKFYGIYRLDTADPDTLLQTLKDREVTHIIMGSLRKNPEINNGQTINTIKRYISFIAQSYPQAFILEHKIGQSEPAYLFRINYSKTNNVFVKP
jgi:hypothetical protein